MSEMPENPTSTPNSTPTPTATTTISAWWVLLLVPVALPVGWLVGGLPGPKPRTQAIATTSVTPGQASGTVGSTSSVEQDTPLWKSDPVPAEEPPAEEAKPAIVSQWTDLKSAMSESERNGKPVLIDFNAEWCGPCQAMKQQLFDDWKNGQAVQTAVIPVSIVDRRREEGRNPPEIENLQQRFQVEAFPTLVVFSPESGKIQKKRGFGDAEATLAWIKEAANAVR